MQFKQKLKSLGKSLGKASLYALPLAAVAFSGQAMAQASVGDMAMTVSKSVNGLQVLIQGVCYMGGIAMAGIALFKFKAHKDNPQQTPLSVPIVMLLVGAGLLYLPSVLSSAGETLWGGDQNSNKLEYNYGTID